MTDDPQTMIGLAVAVVIVVWLVFSVLKKLFGLAIIAGIVLVAVTLWLNPGLAGSLWVMGQNFLGQR